MATPRELTHPPIAEALIDFRVPDIELLSGAALKQAQQELLLLFPKSEEQRAFHARIEMRDGVPVAESQDLGFRGLILKSEDERNVVQMRKDGFTANRISPYMGWEQLKRLALDTFPVFVQYAHPERISRVATRFINHLRLPLAAGQPFTEYLVAPPALPENVQCQMGSFATRVTLQDAQTGISAHLNQSLESAAGAEPVIILDVDVFQEFSAENSPTPESLSELLDRMRILKNAIFFGSITNRALDLYV